MNINKNLLSVSYQRGWIQASNIFPDIFSWDVCQIKVGVAFCILPQNATPTVMARQKFSGKRLRLEFHPRQKSQMVSCPFRWGASMKFELFPHSISQIFWSVTSAAYAKSFGLVYKATYMYIAFEGDTVCWRTPSYRQRFHRSRLFLSRQFKLLPSDECKGWPRTGQLPGIIKGLLGRPVNFQLLTSGLIDWSTLR